MSFNWISFTVFPIDLILLLIVGFILYKLLDERIKKLEDAQK